MKNLCCLLLIVSFLGCRETRIKEIRSVFESHQIDTKEFDGKVISTAKFKNNGELKEYKDKFSYANESGRKERVFWTNPKLSGILLLMDGMTLDCAENHFLYGENWPITYVKHLREELENMQDGKDHSFKLVGYDSLIRITYFRNHTEHEIFKFEGDKVTGYGRGYNVSGSFGFKVDGKDALPTDFFKFDYNEEGKLAGMIRYSIASSTPDIEFQFFYGEELDSIKAYRKNRLLYTSKLKYSDGMKVKTEIFNSADELEYVVNYKYSYY